MVISFHFQGNTDTKHYQSLTDSIYRFQPVLLGQNDLNRFHGIDERISVKNFIQVWPLFSDFNDFKNILQVVDFYYRVIHNADFDIINDDNDEEDDEDSNGDVIFENLSSNEDDYLANDDSNSTDLYW